jgi:HAD superfamily hydrolase (TIGR01490 family)
VSATPGSYAFFDLDGTLISDASVIAFHRYRVERQGGGDAERLKAEFAAALADQYRRHVPRDEINAWFYRTYFRDVEVAHIRALASDWLAMRMTDPGFVKHGVVARLKDLRARGVGTALITGSFREIAQPLARHFSIDVCLCAPLEEIAGRYTGRLTAPPTIGAGKALAITQFLDGRGIAPAGCHGCGDDHTDIPYLGLLGNPAALASGTPELLAHADRHGWPLVHA